MSKENETSSEKKHSTWNHISFNLVMVMLPATYGMFGTHFFWYYETEVLLPVVLVGLANVIYLLWDAFNDPLIGYISDRPNRLSKRYGRRFPYIVIFGIPTMLTMVLLFIPPIADAKTNPIPVFLWATIILMMHETGYTSVSLARALFPEKFRSDQERNKNAGIGILIYNIGMFLGLIVPMMIVEAGDIQSYWKGAAILMIPCFICYLLGIPGVREDKEMIEHAYLVEKEPFFKMMKGALKHKNFIALTIFSVAYQMYGACILGSVYYWTNYVLHEPSANILIMISWFIAGLVSIPFWFVCSKKLGNRKIVIIYCVAVISTSIFVIFIRSLTFAIMVVLLLGVVMGSGTFVRYPIFGDVIDEVSILDGKRQEGVYLGTQAFFDRFGIVLQPIIFTIVHIITGFNPESETQTVLAQQGIIAAMSWIPGLIILAAGLIFWKFYDLTPDKTQKNKAKLEELNL